MRWIAAITLLFCAVLTASPIHKTIDELLNEEQKSLQIPSYDPFKRAKPLMRQKTTKILPRMTTAKTELIAIMDKRAFINGRWYTLGQTLSEGKIIKMDAQSVTLKKGDKIKILRLRQHKKLFSISEKDKK